MPAEDNKSRHGTFLSALNEMDCVFYEGYGTDKNEKWPKEKSYLILNDDHTLMRVLATSYEQNAMLRKGLVASVELLILG